MIALVIPVVFYLYFVWRLIAHIRRRMPVQAEVSWLTFLTVCAVLSLLFVLVPFSRPAAAAVSAAALALVVAVNLYIFRRYDRWLQKQRETE